MKPPDTADAGPSSWPNSWHIPNSWEIVILGSGPVGLTLANLLGSRGVRTLLLERNPATVTEPRAVSIDDESLRTMQAAGVVDAVQSATVAGYGSHYFTAVGRLFAAVEPTGQPYGYPRRNAFRQPILERQLRDGLARFSHVDARYGWTATRHHASANGVTIEAAGPNGTPHRVTCAYLVGCDGAGSRTREQEGGQLSGTSFDERWLIVDLENHPNAVAHTQVFCDRRRPCITLPGPGGTRRFEFKLMQGETDADLLAPGVAERLVASRGADPAATLRRKVVYRFHARVASRWAFGRVLLAGDAAHLTPPFAGQGMNSGIRDAGNLAWKLAAVLRRQAGPALLQTYEQERRDHVWQMIDLALRMGRIMAPRTWLDAALTQGGFMALNLLPPARDYVTQMRYKPPPRFTAGFLVPDGRGRRSIVGRMAPQPRVRTAAGAAVLLDEVLGPGFALLVRTTDPRAVFASLQHPVWRSLRANRVAILPDGHKAVAGEGWTAVVEADGALQVMLAPYPAHAVLLRPDRYIAAAISLSDPAPAARAIEALLSASWARADLEVAA